MNTRIKPHYSQACFRNEYKGLRFWCSYPVPMMSSLINESKTAELKNSQAQLVFMLETVDGSCNLLSLCNVHWWGNCTQRTASCRCCSGDLSLSLLFLSGSRAPRARRERWTWNAAPSQYCFQLILSTWCTEKPSLFILTFTELLQGQARLSKCIWKSISL